MFQTKVVEKIKHIYYAQQLSILFNRAFYYIMWKNLVELDRPQMTIWRRHNSRQVPKVTNTDPEYVILITFLPQK